MSEWPHAWVHSSDGSPVQSANPRAAALTAAGSQQQLLVRQARCVAAGTSTKTLADRSTLLDPTLPCVPLNL